MGGEKRLGIIWLKTPVIIGDCQASVSPYCGMMRRRAICPKCSERAWVKNGRHETKSKGVATRWVCKNTGCGYHTTEYERPVNVFPDGYEFRTARVKVMKAIALLVLGLPFRRVERLVRMKGETIRKHIRILRGEPISRHVDEVVANAFGQTPNWLSVKAELVKRYRFKAEELTDFDRDLDAANDGLQSMSDRAKNYLGMIEYQGRASLQERIRLILGKRVTVSLDGEIKLLRGKSSRRPRAARQG